MKHHIFTESDTYKVALLMKPSAFLKQELIKNYVDPLEAVGVSSADVIAFTLAYNESGKAPATLIKSYLGSLLKALQHLEVSYLYVTDGAYFKALAGVPKAEPHQGYVLPCAIKGYEHMRVVLGIGYPQLFYNPPLVQKLNQGLQAIAGSIQGTYVPPGQGIIHYASYPKSALEIAEALDKLLDKPRLTCDIEGFSLSFDKAGIGTIAFAWSQHEGVAFTCDYLPLPKESADGRWGLNRPDPLIRMYLRDFFEQYQGELIFHGAPYDVKALILNLWMEDLLDTPRMLEGLEALTKRFHDTKQIAYLATNSTAGNKLSLKHLAHDFAGNWAVEVHDITKVPLQKLLQYNLVDALSTMYVLDKYTPIMEADNQGELYRGLFLDSLRLIIQMEMTGMPMSRSRIQKVKAELEAMLQPCLDVLSTSPVIQELEKQLRHKAWDEDYQSRKNKAKNPDKIKPKERNLFDDLKFNPNSGPQLQVLIYEVMNLPILNTTDTGLPATGGDTLEKLLNHTKDPQYLAILNALSDYGKITKILSSFIPAFEGAINKDGSDIVWLHGSFNLGGTVSGRLSSSDPNLQNLPANSTFGKLIKTCFVGPDNWLFCGADFNSLEDYISALTTKDKNKLRVYENGFDGHCLRAGYYYRDQLSHIDLDDPESVNSIKKTHPELRQASKGPTFALTYQGTWITLVNNLGFSEEEAKAIEAGYHALYKESDEYVQRRLKQASKDGYVEVAFGLRVRTPLLKQVVWDAPKMPHEAAAEGRTAGNALGQSYGLLNNRAAVAFFKAVRESPYRFDILPVALVHDAIYVLVKDDPDVMVFANNELIKAMQWQELPEIQHPTVKLGANLDIYWPSWANGITLPNNASREEIIKLCREAKDSL